MLLRLLQRREVLTLKAAMTALKVLDNAQRATLDSAIRELRAFEDEVDESIRFEAAMARYALGDRSGLAAALNALRSGSAITLTGCAVKDEMMEAVNASIPQMRKLMPFEPSDGE
jgi:hypothetical protein